MNEYLGALRMEWSDYIALGALFFSVTAFFISIVTNTKKYELSSAHRQELLNWHNETIETLITLKLQIQHDNYDKISTMSKLSTLIEQGRFYFPNVDKGDGFGKEKPPAYGGYRDIALEFLVYSYNTFQREDAHEYTQHLEQLQRLFTSRIFSVLEPRKHNRQIKKHTSVSMGDGMSLEDFLRADVENLDYFKSLFWH